MKVSGLKVLAAAMVAVLSQQAAADVTCSFDVRSTVEGNHKLSGQGFRVREASEGLLLEQRYADGSWGRLGKVQRLDRPDFMVFLHLPDADTNYIWAGLDHAPELSSIGD